MRDILPCNSVTPVKTQTFDFPVQQLGKLNGENACSHYKLEGDISFYSLKPKPNLPIISEGRYTHVHKTSKSSTVYEYIVYRLGDRWVCKTYTTEEGQKPKFISNIVHRTSLVNGVYLHESVGIYRDVSDDVLASATLIRSGRRPRRFISSGVRHNQSRLSCQSLLNTIQNYYLPYRETMYDEDFADLADQCAANARYLDCNLPMLARELRNLRTSTEAFFNLFQGKLSTKTLANVYLSYKYGARLTVRDARAVLTELDNRITTRDSLKGRVHSRVSRSIQQNVGSKRTITWYYDRVLTIAYHQNPWDVAQRCFHEASNWDALFSLQNIWDFIPYSFVVDWFIDVESALVRLDNKLYWHTLHVDTVISSEKKTADLDASWFYPDAEGIITATFYDRRVSTVVPTGSPRLNPTLAFTNHVPELTALFRQRIR